MSNTHHSWHHHTRWPEVHPWAYGRKRRPLRLYRVVTARDARWIALGVGLGAAATLGVEILVRVMCGG